MSADRPADNGPLIPTPKTDIDTRVNEAHRRATRDGKRHYVYLYHEGVYIAPERPQTFPCIAVDPAGWAIWLAPGADESELG